MAPERESIEISTNNGPGIWYYDGDILYRLDSAQCDLSQCARRTLRLMTAVLDEAIVKVDEKLNPLLD